MQIRKDNIIINTEAVREISLEGIFIWFYNSSSVYTKLKFSSEEVAKKSFELIWFYAKIAVDHLDLTEEKREEEK